MLLVCWFVVLLCVGVCVVWRCVVLLLCCNAAVLSCRFVVLLCCRCVVLLVYWFVGLLRVVCRVAGLLCW